MWWNYFGRNMSKCFGKFSFFIINYSKMWKMMKFLKFQIMKGQNQNLHRPVMVQIMSYHFCVKFWWFWRCLSKGFFISYSNRIEIMTKSFLPHFKYDIFFKRYSTLSFWDPSTFYKFPKDFNHEYFRQFKGYTCDQLIIQQLFD